MICKDLKKKKSVLDNLAKFEAYFGRSCINVRPQGEGVETEVSNTITLGACPRISWLRPDHRGHNKNLSPGPVLPIPWRIISRPGVKQRREHSKTTLVCHFYNLDKGIKLLIYVLH